MGGFDLRHKFNFAIVKVKFSETDLRLQLVKLTVLFIREDLSKIQYSTMFIKESLRLYPPAISIGRSLTSPLSLKKDLTLPSNCNVSFSIFACHRNEHVWENPEVRQKRK